MTAASNPAAELTEAEVNELGPFIWGGWLGVDQAKHSDYAHELLELVTRIKANGYVAARLAAGGAATDEGLRARVEALRATMPHALDCGIPCDCWKRWVYDALAADTAAEEPRTEAQIKAEAWDEGYEAAEHMARCWGHIDSWEDEPTNPYRSDEEKA